MPRIESRIQVISGLRVMLDVDLAALYGVPTKRLNEQGDAIGTASPPTSCFNSRRMKKPRWSQIATTSKT